MRQVNGRGELELLVFPSSPFCSLSSLFDWFDLQLEAVLPLLPSGHPFTHCFEIHTRLDLHTATETVDEMITDLEEKVFSIASTPQGKQKGKAWIWGVSMKGMVAYHQRGSSLSSSLKGARRDRKLTRVFRFWDSSRLCSSRSSLRRRSETRSLPTGRRRCILEHALRDAQAQQTRSAREGVLRYRQESGGDVLLDR